jgi:hypothetical protein
MDLNDDPASKEILSKFLAGPHCQGTKEVEKVVSNLQAHLSDTFKRVMHHRGSFSGHDDALSPYKNDIRKSAVSKPAVPALQFMAHPLNLPHRIREVAIQLTLIEYFCFYKQIRPRELLGQAWTKKDIKETVSPNVVAMINLVNRRIRWVTSEILRYGRSLQDRVDHVEAFIDIASLCLSFGNFNTAFQITNGLAAPAIRKLHAVWARVNSDHITRHEYAKSLSSGDKNAAKYRKELAKWSCKPCIPSIPTSLKDLFQW